MVDISRANALALMAEDRAGEIFSGAEVKSAALQTFTHLPMYKKDKIIPFVNVLPTNGSAFVTGDAGITPQLNMDWATREMTAEVIKGIVPIAEDVLDDTDFQIWANVRPKIEEYVAFHLDQAVYSGVGAPASWPIDGLAGVAIAAGNTLSYATYAASGTLATGFDLGGAFNELLGIVEDDGFEANVVYSKKTIKRSLRNLRDTVGDPIYSSELKSGTGVPGIWDTDLHFLTNGTLASTHRAIAADRNMAILGLRSDMQWRVLDQATLTSTVTVSGTPVRQVSASFGEQGMVGLEFKMRIGFTYMDPTTIEGGTGASPFALMTD